MRPAYCLSSLLMHLSCFSHGDFVLSCISGGVAVGGHKTSGADDEEGILKRFERERKHVSINRKVGAQFNLGFPT
jgi:hypothetical protein